MEQRTGLLARAVRGGMWVFALSVSQEILALARLVILARLLSPDDFGLAGIAVIALTTLDTLTSTGFDTALIQKKEDIRPYLDTAWTVGVLRGFVVFALVLAAAPWAAAFFRTPEATSLVRLIGLSMLARSFTSIGVVSFRKDLEFGKQFAWQFAGRLADFVVAVVAGFVLRNAWALVVAFVAGDAVKLALSYALHPYRPRFALDGPKARELFGFGKWVLGIGVLVFLLTQVDNAAVGRLVTPMPMMLGFYQLARRVANVPATEIAHVLANVTFPAYSKLQDATSKMREAYLMTLEIITLVALPVASAIAVLAPEITAGVFGEKWLPAAPAVRILAVWGAIGALASTAEPVLIAVGRPRTLTKYQAINLVVLAGLLVPLTLRWGIQGASLAMVLAAAGPCLLVTRKVARITACGAAGLARIVAVPLAAAVLAGAGVLLVKRLDAIAAVSSAARLGLGLAAFAALYLGIAWWLGRRLEYRIGTLVAEVLRVIRSRAAR
ncbi:MAG: lipopolysaccharide biosynthesis protein [bacterium]